MSLLKNLFRRLSGNAELATDSIAAKSGVDLAELAPKTSRTNRTYDWEPALPWRSVRLIDGTTGSGWVMRRRAPDGTWQYRAMTDQEALDRAISETQ
ncbi:hypothetical protein [Methylobacterium sp. J-070]|uniref:hypothetical protein n=1 Tax=Methylobacterium sp. J-070 TaxID=2836650 RepID=UPI001FBB4412|nr:hypothetical protein [Methylobacterium sp. J-070]MCJ2053976.1 hypothetical protein [Methylobacterium sp. J-070]